MRKWSVVSGFGIWRLKSIEQAGKGGKRKVGPLALVVPSAPPLTRHMKILAETIEPQRGRARDQWRKASDFPLATLSSLFSCLEAPKTKNH